MIIMKEDEEISSILNTVSFSEAVEEHLRKGKFDNYLSAIVDLCNELDVDEKSVPKLLSQTLREKIRLEAEEEGLLLKKENPMFKF